MLFMFFSDSAQVVAALNLIAAAQLVLRVECLAEQPLIGELAQLSLHARTLLGAYRHLQGSVKLISPFDYSARTPA